MASENKKRKQFNSYCKGSLTNKDIKLKRIMFFNSAKRQEMKQQLKNFEEYEHGT